MAVAITSGAGLTQARRASIFSRALSSPAVIVVVALLLRLGNIFLHHRYDIWPAYAHLFFGYEVGRIASALGSEEATAREHASTGAFRTVVCCRRFTLDGT